MAGENRCTATSKTTKQRCGRSAIPGGVVCRYHGGAAPQVQRKAAERLAALVDPAIDALSDIVKNPLHPDRLRASKDILDRTGHKSPEQIEVKVGNLDESLQERLDRLAERRRIED